MTRVATYEWQVVTGDGSCYKRNSNPAMSLQSWVSEGIAKTVVFQAEGLPTIRFDVSRDMRVIFHRHTDLDTDYRDCWTPGTEAVVRKQPVRKCQVIGHECDGLLIAMIVDLKTGSIELLDGVTG